MAYSHVGSLNLQGQSGPPGQPGQNGLSTLTGVGAPNSSIGRNGDTYIDTSGPTLYGPKTNSGWGSGTTMVGPQGPQGPAGTGDISGMTAGQLVIATGATSATSTPLIVVTSEDADGSIRFDEGIISFNSVLDLVSTSLNYFLEFINEDLERISWLTNNGTTGISTYGYDQERTGIDIPTVVIGPQEIPTIGTTHATTICTDAFAIVDSRDTPTKSVLINTGVGTGAGAIINGIPVYLEVANESAFVINTLVDSTSVTVFQVSTADENGFLNLQGPGHENKFSVFNSTSTSRVINVDTINEVVGTQSLTVNGTYTGNMGYLRVNYVTTPIGFSYTYPDDTDMVVIAAETTTQYVGIILPSAVAFPGKQIIVKTNYFNNDHFLSLVPVTGEYVDEIINAQNVCYQSDAGSLTYVSNGVNGWNVVGFFKRSDINFLAEKRIAEIKEKSLETRILELEKKIEKMTIPQVDHTVVTPAIDILGRSEEKEEVKIVIGAPPNDFIDLTTDDIKEPSPPPTPPPVKKGWWG